MKARPGYLKSSRLGVILYWLRQRVWSVAPLAGLPLQLSC